MLHFSPPPPSPYYYTRIAFNYLVCYTIWTPIQCMTLIHAEDNRTHVTKCPCDKMYMWQNVHVTKCLCIKMVRWLSILMIKSLSCDEMLCDNKRERELVLPRTLTTSSIWALALAWTLRKNKSERQSKDLFKNVGVQEWKLAHYSMY